MILYVLNVSPVLVLVFGCMLGPCLLWDLIERLTLRVWARRSRARESAQPPSDLDLSGIPQADQAAFRAALLGLERELALAGWQHERQNPGEGNQT